MPTAGRPESPEDAFERGKTAGEIAEQLRRHEDHLSKINGSQEKIYRAVADLSDGQQEQTLAIQQIQQQLRTDAETRVTLAAALKEAADKQLSAEDRKFIPWSQVIAVVGALGVFAAIYFQIKG